jgi:hypothetical protein
MRSSTIINVLRAAGSVAAFVAIFGKALGLLEWG